MNDTTKAPGAAPGLEQLNALVDGELDREEREHVLAAIAGNPVLERAACELRSAKVLLRHAYELDDPAGAAAGLRGEAHTHGTGARRAPPGRRWAAALVALGVGLAAGWWSHAYTSRVELERSLGAVVSAGGVRVAAPEHIVLHLPSAEPERVRALLERAELLLNEMHPDGGITAVEIVANGTGLDALRADLNGEGRRLVELARAHPALTLVACGQTLARLREKGVQPRLLPGVTVASNALDQIMSRVQRGWTYVRI